MASRDVTSRFSSGPWFGPVLRPVRADTCTIPTRCVHASLRRVNLYHFIFTSSDLMEKFTVQYGFPDNSSRPGGYLAIAQFKSNNSSSLFVVLSDQSTVTSLIGSVKANCSSHLNQSDTSSSPTPYTNGSSVPVAEQAVQYYRASSVVLALDGYNDTAALDGTIQNANTSTLAVPLPNGTDTTLLTCLNETIGLAVPLVDAGARSSAPGLLTLFFVGLLVSGLQSLF